MLYRVNARSDDLEGPLAAAGIPYQVRGGAFLQRPAARAVLRLLRGSRREPAAGTVEVAAQAAGLVDPIPEGLGDDGVTFQEDLRRLVDLAAALPGDALRVGLRRRPRGALRFGGRRTRRPAAHLPPGQGPRVRGRLSPVPRRGRAALQAGANRRGARRGAPPALRRPDAGEATCSSPGRARSRAAFSTSSACKPRRPPDPAGGREKRLCCPPGRTAPCSRRCGPGVSSGRGRTVFPRTSSSTTRRSRRSPSRGRRLAASLPPSTASARPSSIATAPRCSGCYATGVGRVRTRPYGRRPGTRRCRGRTCPAHRKGPHPGSADSSSSSITAGSRRTRAPWPSRLTSSRARGSVSGLSRPSLISASSTPPRRPPYVV